MRKAIVVGLVLAAASATTGACGGGSSSQHGFAPTDGGGATDGTSSGGGDVGTFGDDGGPSFGDSGSNGQDSGGGTPVALVYAHSDGTLYRMDANSKQIAVVGPFSGCDDVIDIAIDSSSNAYVTSYSGLYTVNLTTAACTLIASGASYPNSLSFVPKGTLDPNVEALVGYVGSEYIRIDTTSGAITNIGTLSGEYTSSGDIVSVINGGSFLTVKGGSENCSDCLLQINPTTGDLVQNYGSVNHTDVFGLAFWAGTAYGFDNGGKVFSIDVQNGQVVTTAIPVPNPPPGLSFWGAGSTTAAPPTSADGGGIPVIQ
jgi:hypothetical protein